MTESTAPKITAILASLLAVERVALEDDFFMLGGDSLAATVLMSALEANYGFVVDPIEIFERPRISEFVAWLDDALQQAGVSSTDTEHLGATEREG